MEDFRTALLAALPPIVPTPGDAQLAAMVAWHQAVVETNARFNLTRITDPVESAVKHFADSLALLGWAGDAGIQVASVLDVGTGAGFPAAPLAILRPDWKVTAIDSTGKKARFVSETAVRVGIPNLQALHARAGRWKPPSRFDLVVFKAVGEVGACLAEARHLVRPGGYVVHYKTCDVPVKEQERARVQAARLGYETLRPYLYALAHGEERLERALWAFGFNK